MDKIFTIKLISLISICALIITSSLSMAYPIYNNSKPDLSSINSEAPTWSIDDSWTYNIDISPSSEALLTLDGSIEDFVMIVVNDETDYELELEGDITGKLIVNGNNVNVQGNLRDATIDGGMTVDKSNIGIKEVDLDINGRIVIALIPVSLSIDLEITFDPSYQSINFPLNVGSSWDIADSDVYITGSVRIGDNLEMPINEQTFAGGGTAECEEMVSIDVDAGFFEDAYKIISDQDVSEIYYASQAGNIIKSSGEDFYYFDYLELTLADTTYIYEQPDAPNTPSKPSGPSSGKPDITYDFSSSTTDNQGDQIYYMFSWGDGTTSEWIGPYNSGETCTESHTWSSEKSYQIKVKAKDDENHESGWSEPLTVSISNAKSKSNIYSLIKNLIERFSFLEFLLDKTFNK